MERYEHVKENKKTIIINNFLGGISWAIGATIGLGIIVVLLGLVLKNINLVPFVGSFVADVIHFVIGKEPTLIH